MIALFGIIASSRPSIVTYADFVTHITSLTTGTYLGSAQIGAIDTNVNIKVGSLAESGTMYGSSWGQVMRIISVTNRVIQHGVDSYATYQSIVANSQLVMLRAAPTANAATNSVSRNGYLSVASGSTTVTALHELWYWDNALGKARYAQPYTGVAAIDYTW